MNKLIINMFCGVIVIILLFTAIVQVQGSEWRQLFNGSDLTGWEHVGSGEFVIEDGLLKTIGGDGLLWYTPEMFGNIVIRVVYKNVGGTNSGVLIRIPERPNDIDFNMPWNRGYEIQIDDNWKGDDVTGVLYSFTRAMARPSHPDEWNTMEITLDGDRTIVRVNDIVVTDYTEGQAVRPERKDSEYPVPDRGPRPVRGFIGLQNHGQKNTVYFREISVRPLNDRD